MHRQADGPAVVGNIVDNRLLNPPAGVGCQPEALIWVKLVNTPHKSHVPTLDKVQKGQAIILILAGNRDDKAQVGLNQLVLSPTASGNQFLQLLLLKLRQDAAPFIQDLLGKLPIADLQGELVLFFLGKDIILTNIMQVDGDGIHRTASPIGSGINRLRTRIRGGNIVIWNDFNVSLFNSFVDGVEIYILQTVEHLNDLCVIEQSLLCAEGN